MPRKAGPPPPCGTPAGYQRHRRDGEEACTPCRKAHTADGRARRHAKKATAVTGPECCCAPCCCDRGGDHCRQAGCPVCIPTTTTETETAVTPEDYCTGTHECGCDDCEQHWADLADIDGETPTGEPLDA